MSGRIALAPYEQEADSLGNAIALGSPEFSPNPQTAIDPALPCRPGRMPHDRSGPVATCAPPNAFMAVEILVGLPLRAPRPR